MKSFHERTDGRIDRLLRKIGEPIVEVAVPDDVADRLTGWLAPEWVRLFTRVGFSGFVGGRLWFVNPLDFEGVADRWVAGTPLEGLDDFAVIARGGFGDLLVLGINSNQTFSINTSVHWIASGVQKFTVGAQSGYDGLKGALVVTGMEPGRLSRLGRAKPSPLFDPIVEQLGALNPDEVFFFAPPPSLLEPAVENAHKGRLDVWLDQHYDMGQVSFTNLDVTSPAPS